MVDVTIFELHLDGSEFTANAPGVGGSDEDATEADDEGGAPLGLFAILALVVLTGVVLAVKKRSGGEADDDIGDEV